METQEHIFKALADASRRKMLDVVKNSPGCNVNDVCAHFAMSRIGVMKHLKILEAAGLILARKEGRDRRLHLNAVPLQMICDRWISQYSALWAQNLTRLKYFVERNNNRRKAK